MASTKRDELEITIQCRCGFIGSVKRADGARQPEKTVCPGCFKTHRIIGPILGVDWHNPEHNDIQPYYVALPKE